MCLAEVRRNEVDAPVVFISRQVEHGNAGEELGTGRFRPGQIGGCERLLGVLVAACDAVAATVARRQYRLVIRFCGWRSERSREACSFERNCHLTRLFVAQARGHFIEAGRFFGLDVDHPRWPVAVGVVDMHRDLCEGLGSDLDIGSFIPR